MPLSTQTEALLMFSCTRWEHKHLMQTQKGVTAKSKRTIHLKSNLFNYWLHLNSVLFPLPVTKANK